MFIKAWEILTLELRVHFWHFSLALPVLIIHFYHLLVAAKMDIESKAQKLLHLGCFCWMLQPICQDSTDKSHKLRTQQQNSYYVAQKQAHNSLKITPLNLKLYKLPKQIKKRSFHHQLPIAVQHLKHFKVATNRMYAKDYMSFAFSLVAC